MWNQNLVNHYFILHPLYADQYYIIDTQGTKNHRFDLVLQN